MPVRLRVSLPGRNALTDTNPRHYSLFADQNNVLIKEHSRGSGNLSAGSATITHGLGYIPFYLIYGAISAGVWQLIGYYTSHHSWRVYATTTQLVISGDGTSAFKYYIFHDNLT